MSSEKIIDSLFDNNLENFRSQVRSALYVKAGEFMNSAKQVVASTMFNPQADNVQEEKELSSKEKQLAAKTPPYDKITRGDVITAAKENAKKKGKK